MTVQPLLLATTVGALLFLLFLFAVREGRFASHRARIAAVAIIPFIMALLWLAPALRIEG